MGESGSKPTIHDVAKLAHTSVGTVSRVLNDHRSVSKEVRQRVFDAVAHLGYTPNAIAQSMRTKSTFAVGLMVTDFSNPLFSIIAKASEETLREERYSLVLANSHDQPTREAELLSFFLQRRVDALMLTISDEHNEPLIEALGKITIPVILLDREARLPLDAVMTDHAQGLSRATEYLIGLGHRRIALITAGSQISPGRQRVAGYRAAYNRNGIPVPDDLIRTGSLGEEFGFEEAFALFQMSDKPTALIAGGNQILTGVMRAVRQLHISIPDQLSLIGCDDSALTIINDPPITVVSRNVPEIGRAAARIILDRLANPRARQPIHITLPTNLIVRDSCQAADKMRPLNRPTFKHPLS